MDVVIDDVIGRSVVELAEQCDAACGPVSWRRAGRNVDGDDEVGRVAGRRQHASPLAGLVQRSRVRLHRRQIRPTTRHDPHLHTHTARPPHLNYQLHSQAVRFAEKKLEGHSVERIPPQGQ